jgi:hypothetical protein
MNDDHWKRTSTDTDSESQLAIDPIDSLGQ